jgi:tetratricopeptide (TPR) repeat protein
MKIVAVGVMGLLAFSAFAAPPGAAQNAVSLFEQGRYDDAQRALLQLSRTSSDPQVFYYLGRTELQQQAFDEAEAHVGQAVRLRPGNSEYHFWLGRIYGQKALRANVLRQAPLANRVLSEFETAVRLDPNNLEARMGLVDYYILAPEFMGGGEEKAAAQAWELRERDAAAGHRAFGQIYVHQGKLDLAEKEYLEWVRAAPSSAAAHYYLGMFELNSRRNYAAAFEQFETAVKADSSFMASFFQIGQAAVMMGANLKRGEESLRKYLSYQPKTDEPSIAHALFCLGGIFEKQGRRDLARQHYADSLRVQAGQKEVAEALKRVSE